jgi:hypothetical protein
MDGARRAQENDLSCRKLCSIQNPRRESIRVRLIGNDPRAGEKGWREAKPAPAGGLEEKIHGLATSRPHVTALDIAYPIGTTTMSFEVPCPVDVKACPNCE